ncbi:Cysteine-rich secretory protein, allergen V5/Tpx-1-related [Trema orientale]|uniref:Cysteine-rich secretory protein, allergen V5/Tpx-1-related n=1 Tax=Trema orientale TaxID=63057 RepID=A0A2P5AAT5_TREOI|nr:Cysteine-rich secretory protein, allergen V5/Tpx-1-related [Trema orientale]
MGSSTKSLEATIVFFMGLTLIITTQALQASKYQSHIDFVATHNAIRAEVGVGPLSWNKTLAAYARNYANSKIGNCEMEHSGGPYGENLAEGYGHMSGEEAVKFWATEKANYDYASNKCVNDECGHYTQVVWRNSVHLGCARAKCRNGWMFVICSYDPPGNYEGERPY